jgi:hypothetical protein
MINNVLIYHFTKKENVESIFQNGLKHGTKYNTLGSQLRIGANYFWFSPAHDLMNYKDNEDYECLQISIDSKLCIVGSMDLISSAFVNFVLEKKNESLYDYKELVKLFDLSAVNYDFYENGLFRAPEIMIQNDISPDSIKVINPLDIIGSFSNNREIYYEKLKQKLCALTLSKAELTDIHSTIKYLEKNDIIKKIALHDDSFGMLQSYIVNGSKEFFTIELTCN